MKMFGDLDMSSVIVLDELVGKEVVCTNIDWFCVDICTVLDVDKESHTAQLSTGEWVSVNSLRYA